MLQAVQAGDYLQPFYKSNLVILSYGLSVTGSFIALNVAQRIRNQNRGISVFNLMAASTALGGIGVWSMHFTGMLALDLRMGSGYSMLETLASLIIAIGATAAALGYVVANPESSHRILGAGSLLGLGVAAMHYLGMYGMRFPGYIIWSWPFVALSIAIAMVAASVALWLTFRTRSFRLRFIASIAMGIGVCSMHYTGMAAADFICTSSTIERFATPQGIFVVNSLDLPVFVGVLAVGMSVMIAYEQILQRTISE